MVEPSSMFAEGHEYKIVPLTSKPVSSIPLFLPDNLKYDHETGTVIPEDANNLEMDPDAGKGNRLKLVPKAGIDLLRTLQHTPLSCISCIGPYRTGKSFLLSRFLGSSQAFAIGPTLEGCTRGIWLSTSAIVQKDPITESEYWTLLLDCEGADDPLEGDDAKNARVALACLLLSSVFCFNNIGRPDRNSLQFLSYLETIRKRIPSPAMTGDEENGADAKIKEDGPKGGRGFPSFVWVFRDFFLQLPKRKGGGADSGGGMHERYTLKEYMLERVLKQQGSVDSNIVDCLLSDFQSFDALSVVHPGRSDDQPPFDPDEMSSLDMVDWEEFSDEFKSNIERVISVCLNRTFPFKFGTVNKKKNKGWFGGDITEAEPVLARGPQFAAWCERVEGLVNSEDVLPDIPDIQHHLLQSLADDAVDKATATYAIEMWKYLDGCPVFNEFVKGMDITENIMMAEREYKGVSEEFELREKSNFVMKTLETDLKADIISEPMLEAALRRLRSRCTEKPLDIEEDPALQTTSILPPSVPTPSTIVLVQCLEENRKRSQTSCDILARSLYDGLRDAVRIDATGMTNDTFDEKIGQLRSVFERRARGPFRVQILDGYLKEQEQQDRVFLEKVHGVHNMYLRTLEEKVRLDHTLEAKREKIHNLERSLEEENEKHQRELKKMKLETQDKIENLEHDHAKAIETTIKEQKDIEAENIAKLTDKMNSRLNDAEERRLADLEEKRQEMEALKDASAQKLAEEINIRDLRIRRVEDAHDAEVKRLLDFADERMKEEILVREEQRKEALKSYEQEARKREGLLKAKMEDEIKKKDELIRMKEDTFGKSFREKERELDDLQVTRRDEIKKYEEEIEKLSQQCNCVIM